MSNLKIFTENIEDKALEQVNMLLEQEPFKNCKVRIMPDVHAGKGCVIGFTADLGNKVIPNIVGVDIGCGMLAVELGSIDIKYDKLDDYIRSEIPSGSSITAKAAKSSAIIKDLVCYEELRNLDRLTCSMGTLGGGNHFIEVDVDDDGNKYLIIHSGSRNLGLQVAHIYQDIAVTDCKTAADAEKEAAIKLMNEQKTPDRIPDLLTEISKKYSYKTKIPSDFCYLEGKHYDDYMHDMRICQEFARLNRMAMAEKIKQFLKIYDAPYFETVHNFIDDENVVRKGAIPARKGQKVLIPMNMRDGCLIATGLGNPDWNYSAPHGAGRILKRSEARELFSVEEYAAQMQGIYTTSVSMSTIDESPMAYKPMDEIVRLIGDTVRIEKIIKPVYNFKAG